MIPLSSLRQFRLGPFSFFDTVTAYGGMLLLSPLLSKLASKIHLHMTYGQWVWLTLPIAVIVHALLRLHTPLMAMLTRFPTAIPASFVLLGMTYMGVRKAK